LGGGKAINSDLGGFIRTVKPFSKQFKERITQKS
jgi:hypothetical protein